MYAIVGASGNTGSVVAQTLLAGGKKVRALTRNPAHVESLTKQGAEAFTASATDPAELIQAFDGAESVYLMLPPAPAEPDVLAYQDRVSDALASAVEKAGVRKAVALSSIGADKAEKVGPSSACTAWKKS